MQSHKISTASKKISTGVPLMPLAFSNSDSKQRKPLCSSLANGLNCESTCLSHSPPTTSISILDIVHFDEDKS